MNPSLHTVVIENFKTYGGIVQIGPMKSFMSVIGPNGTGKSNFLDAVLFAFGENASNLRVKHLSELINGAHVGQPVAEKASVSVLFTYKDETACLFKRTVLKSSQQFSLNNENVSKTKYHSELETLGINIKAKSFFVYQGRIESIAMMNPKERTAMFEEISGSSSFTKEYNHLKSEMNKAEDFTQMFYAKQRIIKHECNDAKLERDEAKKFEQYQKELAHKILELQLFKLFHNEKNIEKIQYDLSLRQEKFKESEKKRGEAETKLKQANKHAGVAGRELDKLEKDVQEGEKKVKQMRQPLIQAKEEVQHMNRKMETAKMSLKQAQEAHNKHLQVLKVLHGELVAVKREQKEFEAKGAEENLNQGIDVELEASQAETYNEKKREVASLSASYHRTLECLMRERKADQDHLDNVKREYSEIKSRMKQRNLEKEEAMKRCEKLSECVCSDEKNMKELRLKLEGLSSDSITCKEQLASIQKDLDDLNAQINDALTDKYEERRQIRKHEIIKSLKELFPGVFGRLVDLCRPVHPKYAIALTKVMGKLVEAIVVEKESTARQCIRYLREQMMDPETFLPLDFFQVKPLMEHLRKMKKPKNSFLLYDAIECTTPQVQRAVLFATKSVIVCENVEDAMDVAYRLCAGRQLDAVALDGTYFQKSGLISGGSAGLAMKAKRWDEKVVVEMKAQKEKLKEHLRHAMKKSRSGSELSALECQVQGFNTRLLIKKKDLEKSLSNIRGLDEEIDKLETKLNEFEPKLRQCEEQIERHDLKVKKLEKKLHSIEDKVFGEFCARISVPNIRAYEKAGLRAYEARVKACMEFEDRKNRIQNQIDYEKTVDTESNIARWSDEVQRRKDAWESAKLVEEGHLKDLGAVTCDLEQQKAVVSVKRCEVDTLEKNVVEAKKEVKAASEEVQTVLKEMLTSENQVVNLQTKRRSLLIQCAVEDISIHLLEGSLNVLVVGRGKSTTESSTSASVSTSDNSGATTSSIIVDYNRLDNALKGIISADKVQECEGYLKEEIVKLSAKLGTLIAPNLRVGGKLEQAAQKLRGIKEEFCAAREKSRETKAKFESVKKLRYNSFMECFDCVSNAIDGIYKQMTKSTSAMALLTADDPEEPYLNGISYCCIAPGKPCRPMHSLSGGEKSIASVALIVALHQYRVAPCLLLDEIDAALDSPNIMKIVDFFNQNKAVMQTIAVSLRPKFYSHVDGLIGITRDGKGHTKSEVFQFDLAKYPE